MSKFVIEVDLGLSLDGKAVYSSTFLVGNNLIGGIRTEYEERVEEVVEQIKATGANVEIVKRY